MAKAQKFFDELSAAIENGTSTEAIRSQLEWQNLRSGRLRRYLLR